MYDLKVDEVRIVARRVGALPDTGILVRARTTEGEYKSVDITILDRDSLLRWLRSRGGANQWAEEVVCILLKHERNQGK
jgi:hypothetical protein